MVCDLNKCRYCKPTIELCDNCVNNSNFNGTIIEDTEEDVKFKDSLFSFEIRTSVSISENGLKLELMELLLEFKNGKYVDEEKNPITDTNLINIYHILNIISDRFAARCKGLHSDIIYTSCKHFETQYNNIKEEFDLIYNRLLLEISELKNKNVLK